MQWQPSVRASATPCTCCLPACPQPALGLSSPYPPAGGGCGHQCAALVNVHAPLHPCAHGLRQVHHQAALHVLRAPRVDMSAAGKCNPRERGPGPVACGDAAKSSGSGSVPPPSPPAASRVDACPSHSARLLHRCTQRQLVRPGSMAPQQPGSAQQRTWLPARPHPEPRDADRLVARAWQLCVAPWLVALHGQLLPGCEAVQQPLGAHGLDLGQREGVGEGRLLPVPDDDVGAVRAQRAAEAVACSQRGGAPCAGCGAVPGAAATGGALRGGAASGGRSGGARPRTTRSRAMSAHPLAVRSRSHAGLAPQHVGLLQPPTLGCGSRAQSAQSSRLTQQLLQPSVQLGTTHALDIQIDVGDDVHPVVRPLRAQIGSQCRGAKRDLAARLLPRGKRPSLPLLQAGGGPGWGGVRTRPARCHALTQASRRPRAGRSSSQYAIVQAVSSPLTPMYRLTNAGSQPIRATRVLVVPLATPAVRGGGGGGGGARPRRQ